VRTGEPSQRKTFRKSHVIVGYWWKGILSHAVTEGHRHDAPVFSQLMKKLPDGDYECMSGDTAYCSRKNCTLVSQHHMQSFFKPRSDATAKAKGSTAWRDMVRCWNDDRQRFDESYHRRSVVESVIGAEKQRLGHTLFSRRATLQDKELRLKTICYNLLVVNKMKASQVLGEPPLQPVPRDDT